MAQRKTLHCLQLLLALIMLLFQNLSAYFNTRPEDCDELGWFGGSCVYKCRCKYVEDCDLDGNCAGGCAPGWFGEQCQQRSSPVEVLIEGYPTTFLTDDDHRTCYNNTDPYLLAENFRMEIRINLVTPHLLTWLRVERSGLTRIDPIRFDFIGPNGTEVCPVAKMVWIAERFDDVHCRPAPAIVSSIILSGMGIWSLCSLHVNLGTNVALRRLTQQSSEMDIWIADNAVDGDTGPWDDEYGQAQTCTHTTYGDNRKYWGLFVPFPVHVTMVMIHNRVSKRMDCCEYRLMGFTIDFKSFGILKYSYTDYLPMPQEVYKVVPKVSWDTTLTALTIFASEYSDALSLCEVEVYAERECELGKYGRECKKTCQCDFGSRVCYPNSGICPSGCRPGYRGELCSERCPEGTYGTKCQKKCSEYCKLGNTACDSETGACEDGCMPGYKPPTCDYQMCDGAGWFGHQCHFKCHCYGGDSYCNSTNGQCSPHPDMEGKNTEYCAPGWFGSDCQQRMAKLKHVPFRPILPWLSDQDETTCNDNYTRPFFRFQIEPTIFDWIRIVVKNTDYMPEWQIFLSLNEEEDYAICFFNESMKYAENSRDYVCSSMSIADGILFMGPHLSELCAIYISTGQNTALKRPDIGMLSPQGQASASLAVDGDATTCASGTVENDLEYFYVSFAWPILVHNIMVIPPEDCCWEALSSIRIEVYSAFITVYNETMSFPRQDSYPIIPREAITQEVSDIRIQSMVPGATLSICEMEVYGEISCVGGKYGLECENKCNCNKIGASCNTITGGCLTGCLYGFTGKDCWQRCPIGTFGVECKGKCSDHCDGGLTNCNPEEGTCVAGCEPGYMPPYCNMECPDGKFGWSCYTVCMRHCIGGIPGCDKKTGRCKFGCAAGYQPPDCSNECPRLTYGYNCSGSCSSACLDLHCDISSGQCFDCPNGTHGTFCENTCDKSFYGPSCQLPCPENCMDSECDPAEGTCFRCIRGFTGDKCKSECDIGFYGDDCKEVCSEDCKGGLEHCDAITGHCAYGCVADKEPPLCINALSVKHGTANNNSWRDMLTNDGLIILSCIFLFLLVYIILEWVQVTVSHYMNRVELPPTDSMIRLNYALMMESRGPIADASDEEFSSESISPNHGDEVVRKMMGAPASKTQRAKKSVDVVADGAGETSAEMC